MPLPNKKIIILLLMLYYTNVFADPIKQIIFFGDSLTDNGNLYKHDFKIMPKDPPYYQGRFSNGPTWAEHLGNYYYARYNINYDIYAVGGATVVLCNPLKGCLPLTLKAEIDDYFFHTAAKDRANTLFIIWIGANDYISETKQDPNSFTDDVIKQLSTDITALLQNGGKHFALLDLPDLSKTPRELTDHTPAAQRLHILSELHHQKMLATVNQFRNQYPNATFSYVDTYAIFNDIIENTKKYNQKYNLHITNIAESCWEGGYALKKLLAQNDAEKELNAALQQADNSYPTGMFKNMDPNALTQYMLKSPALAEAYKVGKLQASGIKPCVNPDDYMFWDQIHPTEVTHQLFADIVLETLENEIKSLR